MKRLIFLIISILAVTPLSAQSFDELRQGAMAGFRANRDKSQKDYEDFRNAANASYAENMRRDWTRREGQPAVPQPKEKEPDVPPVVLPEIELPEIPDDNEIPFDEILPVVIDDTPVPIVPLMPLPKPREEEYNIVYYGTPCSVRFDPSKKFRMADASEDSAADMWTAMSSDVCDNLLADCLSTRDKLALCDWGYFTFLDCVCSKIYGSGNEAVMLKAFLLSQSGYKIRLARSKDGAMKLLVSFTDDIYDYGYFTIGGVRYYLIEKNNENSLYVFEQEFPNEKSLRMSVGSAARFADKASSASSLRSKRFPDVAATASLNENLIGFYNDYPISCKRNQKFSQWVFYANTQISDAVKASIYPVLRKAISGKSQADAANILINFVQTAFEYKTDEEVWGRERPFFPEETLYYPYSDCEDRAILYSRLVRDLMGLKAVLLYYPGHLASAVAFTEPVTGDYLNVSGTRYLVCDPTYINAPIGKTMPGMDNSGAVVVMLE